MSPLNTFKLKTPGASIVPKGKSKKIVSIQTEDNNYQDEQYDQMVPEQIQLNIEKSDEANSIGAPDQYEPEQVAYTIDDDGNLVKTEGEHAIKKALNEDFYENLANHLEFSELDDISTELREKYEQDRSDRSKRDEQYQDGLKRAGLDESETTGGANFEGASKVAHPMMAQNSVEFAAREIKELCPPNGPVKTKIVGIATSKKIDEAARKADFINTMVITDMIPYRNVMENMLSQLPLGGSQFIKWWYDEYLHRPNCEFLPIDNVYIPYSSNNFYTSDRVTVYMELSNVEYWRRIDNGLYYDPVFKEDPEGAMPGDPMLYQSKTAGTNAKIEGKINNTEVNTEETQTLIEVYTFLEIEGDSYSKGKYAPYIVTVNLSTDEIVGLYRNWNLDDPKMHKLDYIVEFKFVPWRGAYGIGLPQLIGGLSKAATGALRALLDAAHINNLPSVLALKGIKMAGQSPDVNVGSITFLEGPSGLTDDIKKCFMPLPFNPPSATLYQLLDWLTNAASQVVKTPDGFMQDMSGETPANTMLAGIEHSSATQSAIHARLHHSSAKCLQILCRLLKENFDERGYPSWLLEDLKINEGLFEQSRDIIPVSDPNIFTEAQRYAQLQSVMQLADKNPQMFNMTELYRRNLQLIKIPDPDMLLNIPNQVTRSNPIAENMALFLGSPIQAYPDQDHLAHIKLHMQFLSDPVYGQNPAFNQSLPPMVEHIKEHLAYYYAQSYQNALDQKMGKDKSFGIAEEDRAEEKTDQILLELSQYVPQFISQNLSPFEQTGMAVLQKLQQMQSSQPQDPALIKAQADMQDVQRETQKDQMEYKTKQQQLGLESQKIQIEQEKAQDEARTEKLKVGTDVYKHQNELQTKTGVELLKHQQFLQQQQLQQHQQNQNHAVDLKKHSADLTSDMLSNIIKAETTNQANNSKENTNG